MVAERANYRRAWYVESADGVRDHTGQIGVLDGSVRGSQCDGPERSSPIPLFGRWGRSGLPERVRRPTRPPPERSVECGGFGILEKERDVADAQAAILKERAREITSNVIEDLTE